MFQVLPSNSTISEDGSNNGMSPPARLVFCLFSGFWMMVVSPGPPAPGGAWLKTWAASGTASAKGAASRSRSDRFMAGNKEFSII